MRKTTWNTSSTQKRKQRHPYRSAVLLMAMGLLLSGNMPAKAAVTQEDLANPVVDTSTHNPEEIPFQELFHPNDKNEGPHKTTYHYVYFGNYPQREIKGEELTDDIINASYDQYGNGEVNGKKYKRLTNELTSSYGTLNSVTAHFSEKAVNGYRYYLYEPIKWRILENDGSKLFLFADRALDDVVYSIHMYEDTWSECELRKWLNYDGGEPEVTMGKGYCYKTPGFMYYAFSEEEKRRIQVTTLASDVSPRSGWVGPDYKKLDGGEATQDKIFIPSYTELTKSDYGTCCSYGAGCTALARYNTDYSRSLNLDGYFDEERINVDYWLRTVGQPEPSDALPCVLAVYTFSDFDKGHLKEGYVSYLDGIYVVPALNANYTLNDCIRVSFATGTDTKVEDQILLGSNYAREPVTTTENGAETKLLLKKEGYEFTGWYLDEACTKPYSFNRKLTQDTTLYAGWKGKPAAPAGLKGGVMKIEGTTSAMEYAASKDSSGGWTDCQEGTTVVPSAGTWYVRYKETAECFAGETAEVTVITAEEAVAAYIREHNIPQATAAITRETIENTSGEKDMEGSTFSILQAKTGKVTSKTVGLKWKAVEEADGYEIYGNKCGKKNKYQLITTVAGSKGTSFTQKKLKKGTYYKYIVRAYKEVEGKKVSLAVSKTIHVTTTGGKYGNAKSVKIKTDKKLKKKKGTYTVELKKNKKYSLKASETKQNKKIKKHRANAYESGDTGIATVTAKGVIKGKQKGTCYIYVYAQNGMCQKIKVKVR